MSYADKIKTQQREQLLALIKWFGSQSTVAFKLDVSPQVVTGWVNRGRISAKSAITAQRVTEGAFTKERLRPDVREWSA